MKKTRTILAIIMSIICVSTLSGCSDDPTAATPYADQLEEVEEEIAFTYNRSFSESDYDNAFTVVQSGLLDLNEKNIEEVYYQAQILTTSNRENDRQMAQRAIRKAKELASKKDESRQQSACFNIFGSLALIMLLLVFLYFEYNF